MIQKKNPAEICPTCNNIKTCKHRKDTTRPVFFCEEFDDSSAPAQHVIVAGTSNPEKHVDITMGLCCDCDNRNSCKLARVPGGIWHCEEYS
jgi:hypothetical protein